MSVAQQHKVQAEIARMRDEFRRLGYAHQLAYLTVVRRVLFRLLQDDEAVSRTIRERFKPLLKEPGTVQHPPRPEPADGEPAIEALRLIHHRPARFSPAQAAGVLESGSCAARPRAEIERAITRLRDGGLVILDQQGRLRPNAA
jgi:hypothetical protein